MNGICLSFGRSAVVILRNNNYWRNKLTDLISSDLSDDEKNSWGTDPNIFNAMNKEFNFVLDAAASNDNAKCDVFINQEMNAITTDWYQYILDTQGDDYIMRTSG